MLIYKILKTNHQEYIYDPYENEVYKLPKNGRDILEKRIVINDKILSKEDKLLVGMINNGHFKVPERDFPKKKNYINTKEGAEIETDSLLLEATQNCNYRCSYCSFSGIYNNRRTHDKEYMSFETAKKAIDLLYVKNSLNIGFYGGEPLLNFSLIKKVIEYAASRFKNVTFSLTTNGDLLSSKVIELFVKNDVNLTVSLDGPEEIHNLYRGKAKSDNSFKKIISNLKQIKKLDNKYYANKVRFACVLKPPHNYTKIDNFFNTNKLVSSNEVFFIHVCNTNFETDIFEKIELSQIDKDFISKSEDDFIESLSKDNFSSKLTKALYNDPYSAVEGRIGKIGAIPLNGCCIPVQFKLFVDVFGNFHLCERTDNSLNIGNIEIGINNVVIDKMTSDYLNLWKKHCSKCWINRYCPNCFAFAINSGNIREKDFLESCEVYKISTEKAFEQYLINKEKNIS